MDLIGHLPVLPDCNKESTCLPEMSVSAHNITRRHNPEGLNLEQDRQYMYNVTLRRVRGTVVAVEKQ